MNDLYALLLKRRLTTSRHHASKHYFQKASNYLALGQPSDSAMINVFRRLIDEGRWATAFRVAHMILFPQVRR